MPSVFAPDAILIVTNLRILRRLLCVPAPGKLDSLLYKVERHYQDTQLLALGLTYQYFVPSRKPSIPFLLILRKFLI